MKSKSTLNKRGSIDILAGPILSSLVRFALPFMLTSLFTTFYTLTDLIWLGRLSSDAVAAAGVIGYLIWMGDSVALIARTGLGVVTAQKQGAGAKDIDDALSAGLALSFISALIFAALMFLISDTFVSFYKLGEKVNVPAGEYAYIVFLGMIFKIMHFSYSQAYQSLGDSKKPFLINLIGLITNVILDPVLIFGFGPIPALGIAGAAWATTIAQLLVFLVFYLDGKIIAGKFTVEENPLAHIGKIRFFKKQDKGLFKKIFFIGLPVFLMSTAFCIISMILNRMMSTFGALAVAVSTIGSQLESLNWMTVEGFGGALTAMTAQNIGAKNRDRVFKIMDTGIMLITSIGLAVMALFLLFGRQLFVLFLPFDKAGQDLGTLYLFIFSFSEVFMALETASASCYNAMGRTLPPALISVIFNCMRIPLGLFLMPKIGIAGVWAAMSISSVLKGTILFIILRRSRGPKLNELIASNFVS